MKLITINDCHIGGPHQIHSHDEIVHTIKNAKHPVAYLGDNYDVSNCKRDDVLKIISQKKYVYTMMRPQDVFVRGNHGLNCIEAPDRIIKDGVLYTHGHYFFWSKERADSFVNKSAGAGFFKRNFITRPLDTLRHLKEGGLNDEAKKNIMLMRHMTPTVHTIICGHRHNPENIIEYFLGVKVIILKRGIQTLDLDEV